MAKANVAARAGGGGRGQRCGHRWRQERGSVLSRMLSRHECGRKPRDHGGEHVCRHCNARKASRRRG